MEIIADLVSVHDHLAVWSGKRRTARYIRVRRIARTGDLVTITLADGPAQTVHKNQRIRVASRTQMR